MVEHHYRNILARGDAAFAELLSDVDGKRLFVTAHNGAAVLENLVLFVQGRPEDEIYALALVEYQHALYSVAFGQYRQAHVSLRLFLELSLCCILFSAHEIDARDWLRGAKDSNWNSIVSADNGVFSKQFIASFFFEMKDYGSQYRSIAEKLYRECSEFVHGNRRSYDGVDSEIYYNHDVFRAWIERADTARLIVKFAFICRFLALYQHADEARLESLAMDYFADLPPVQAIFTRGK